ncbi:MAG: hypothetical protein Q9181_004050 [Wetmoreana brouardii]
MDAPGIFCSISLADDKPVVVVVPAAWHSPIHYTQFTDQLNRAGFETASLRLPSCDSSHPQRQSVTVDAVFIREKLLMPSINAARRVVLVVHSYAGGPGAMAAKGLSIAERRAAGKHGGVIGLIFISAFVAKEGQSLLSGSGGKFAPWVIEHSDGQLGVRNAKEVFYNGVPDALADFAVRHLKLQARASAETLCGPPAWADAAYNGRRAFVLCTLDNAIPLAAQEAMIQQSGVQWDLVSFKTGHAPFLSQPKELSTWTIAEISKFNAIDNTVDE